MVETGDAARAVGVSMVAMETGAALPDQCCQLVTLDDPRRPSPRNSGPQRLALKIAPDEAVEHRRPTMGQCQKISHAESGNYEEGQRAESL